MRSAPLIGAFIFFLLIPPIIKAQGVQFDWVNEIFEKVKSYQFVFTVKTQGNRNVEKTTQKLLHYTWNLHATTVLVTNTTKLRRYSPYRHQLTRFVQVLVAQESELGILTNNPIWLSDDELTSFNLNTGVYTDIYLIFNVKTPQSQFVYRTHTEHCPTPSNYHVFQISSDGEYVTAAIQMESLTGDIRWVRCCCALLWHGRKFKYKVRFRN